MQDYVPVLRTPELGPGQMREVRAHGRRLVVVNVGQTYYALAARCPNDGTDLGREGRLKGFWLICPRDDAAYDVRTGERVDRPAGPPLARYAIRVAENQIQVGPRIS